MKVRQIHKRALKRIFEMSPQQSKELDRIVDRIKKVCKNLGLK